MSSPADTASNPASVLEARLRDRSGGSMMAALRDVWQMACRRCCFAGSYQDAGRILAGTGRYRLEADAGGPLMVRQTRQDDLAKGGLSPALHG